MYKWCSIPNHTYSILNLDERLTAIKGENEVIGFFGATLDYLLIEKRLRKCKLIGESILGEKLDNGTWTAPFIDTSIETWMQYSHYFHNEKFMIFDEIHEDIIEAESEENVSNILSCFNFNFSLIFSFVLANLLSFLMWILMKLLLSYKNDKNLRKRRRRKKEKRIPIRQRIGKILINYINNDWNFDCAKLTKKNLFTLFYVLYLWFIQLVIANNIKTTKVIVDQSMLIKDEVGALMSKKTVCFLENQLELEMIKNSYSNILTKLYNQKNIYPMSIEGTDIKIGDRCYIKEKMDINFKMEGLFTVLAENMIWAVFSMINKLKSGLVIWFSKEPIVELTHRLIFKNDKYLSDIFNPIVLYYFESGTVKKSFESVGTNSIAFLQSNTVYRTVEEFIEGNSKFTDLKMESFKLLFIIYISFCLIVLIINLFHYLFKKIYPLKD